MDNISTLHRLVRVDPVDKNKQKTCAYCQFRKIRTKNGYTPKSYYECEACQLPLCKSGRNCFLVYHKLLFDGKLPSGVLQ